MPSIEMRFSNLIDADYEEILNKRAIDWDTSFSYVFLEGFQRLIEHTLIPKRDGRNYFDLIFLIVLEKNLISPTVKFKTYLHNALKMPMFVFTRDYVTDPTSGEKIYITDKVLNEIGKQFEENFDYEYIGYKRN